jgi:hypothetical protein
MMSRSEQYLTFVEGFKLGSLGVSRKPVVSKDEPEKEPLPSKPTGFEQISHTFVVWKEPVNAWGKKLGWSKDICEGDILTIGFSLEEDNGSTVAEIMLTVYIQNIALLKATYHSELFHFKHGPGTNWFTQILPDVKYEGLKVLGFPNHWKKVFEKKIG